MYKHSDFLRDVANNDKIFNYYSVVEYTKIDRFNNKAVLVKIYECVDKNNTIVAHIGWVMDRKSNVENKVFYDSESLDNAQRWAFEKAIKITSSVTKLYSKGNIQ